MDSKGRAFGRLEMGFGEEESKPLPREALFGTFWRCKKYYRLNIILIDNTINYRVKKVYKKCYNPHIVKQWWK